MYSQQDSLENKNYSQQKYEYKIKNLDEVNSSVSDFGTSYFGDRIIYSSSKNKFNSNNKKWDGNNQPFLELYVGNPDQEDGEIMNETLLSSNLNSRYHDSNAIFTKDLSRVYFTRNNYIHDIYTPNDNGINLIQLYTAKVNKKGKWTHIKPMPFNSKEYQTGHPALSPDETKLYFTSDMPGSIGKTDIWMVDVLEDDNYGDPVNLGSPINSISKEMFPFVSEDNKLYYSSNRSNGGLGGLDIYVSKIESEGVNSEIKLLEEPINSVSDDFAFIINETTNTGYLSSNRLGGKGDDDIYFFERSEECTQVAEGVVTDKKTNALIPGATVVLYDEAGKALDNMVVGFDAKFSFDIDCESSYKVIGSKDNYTEDTEEFVSKAELELDINLSLNPIAPTVVNVSVDKCQDALDLINNIYFDLDQSYIRPDAASELDKVIRIMNRCPNIQVEAASHTDSRAPRKYNLRLSQKRAQSTANYIIRRGGISPNRIRAVGYGEERLKNRCSDGVKCTEIEHQVNRRSEFKIKNW